MVRVGLSTYDAEEARLLHTQKRHNDLGDETRVAVGRLLEDDDVCGKKQGLGVSKQYWEACPRRNLWCVHVHTPPETPLRDYCIMRTHMEKTRPSTEQWHSQQGNVIFESVCVCVYVFLPLFSLSLSFSTHSHAPPSISPF